MTRARADGLSLLLLGAAMFVLTGAAADRIGIAWMLDFKGVYYGTRCLLQRCDPYRQDQIERVYLSEGGENSADAFQRSQRQVVTRYVNSPTAFLLVAPFAVLPWGAAHALWMIANGAGLLLAAALIWNIAAEQAPRLSGALICIWLINSIGLLLIGNAAGIAISLCVVAVWCFMRQRFVHAGVVCMAASLALKPHDAGFVWLFFLLAGGVLRRRALQTLAVAVVMGAAAILWVTMVAPHWLPEMSANLAAISVDGGINNPSPPALNVGTVGMIIDLQTVTSVFTGDPRFYNVAVYATCGPLLLAWSIAAVRLRASQTRAWIALAAIAALSMLPVYHRAHDAKLLLLAVPACAILAARGDATGRLAVLTTAAGFVLTGDVPLILLLNLSRRLADPSTGIVAKIVTIVVGRPAPMILLVVACFYLWVNLRRKLDESAAGLGEPNDLPGGVTPA